MEKQTKRGIPIRKLNYIMAAITLIVSIVLLVVSYRTFILYGDLQNKTNVSNEGQRSARDMQEASDYLTEQVRCFVETGDRTYLDNYFKETGETRRRENALTQLAATSANTAEYAALQGAMNESVALMQTEYRAMRLSIEARGYDLSGYPAEVRDAALTAEETALSAEQKVALARESVFDDAYHAAKERIAQQTSTCLKTLVDNMQKEATETAHRFGVMIRVEQILIIALIAIVLVIVLLTTLQVIEPLIRAIPRIRDDKPIPVSGASEFRFLANTYNHIYEENRNQKEELEYEASHDQLTGVFNRKGFEEILKQADRTKTTLLLIDVDRFKKINDTYGHTAGDRVLARVAGILAVNFRTEDALCRIGGDEFVLFLRSGERISRDVIKQKIDLINGELQKGDLDTPPTSISVGVAFGEDEPGVQIYKKADKALYTVKENGRCGCAFAD